MGKIGSTKGIDAESEELFVTFAAKDFPIGATGFEVSGSAACDLTADPCIILGPLTEETE